MLAGAGATLILSDLDPQRASRVAKQVGGTTIDPDRVSDTACDILAPCAIGATLNQETIPRLNCRAIAGSANNQLEEDADAERLHKRGILYAPDYVVNAGGAMAFALFHEGKLTDAEVEDRIAKIGDSLDRILSEAKERNESPLNAATKRVEQVLGHH
jgi:leucine dehydrogenase